MAVFRVEKSQNYTVMSNYHLRDKELSLKAKGLLSQMLSLPDDWDYTLAGLSHINRESKDAIRSAVNELEAAGYIRRHQKTDASGKFSGNEYVIHESPLLSEPSLEKPSSGNPTADNPSTGKPSSGNPTQLNIDITNTQKQNTDVLNTDSIPFPSDETQGAAAWLPEVNRRGSDEQYMDSYRELIRDNIEYDILLHNKPYEKDRLDEIVELMTETVCSKRRDIRNLKERIHENGIDYVLCGDYYIPEIQIPRQDRPIGHYGRLRKAYLQEFKPVLYQGYMAQGKLFEHLADVNAQAQERMKVMMEQIIRECGVDEALKAKDEMGWVQIMNQAQHCADEVIKRELIYC